ncbi:hypothetical protein HQ560_22150 [bacterium]|nr:hypothetical protein [bacterium]
MALLLAAAGLTHAAGDARIRPWTKNPRYWQYKGEPVLLLGGSKDDSLFQIPDLEEHLDLLAKVGGNVIRNTMSDRRDHDFEVYPFKELPSGKYDLEQWNDEYWRRFEALLRLTDARDIIVQIEVWDRFDYAVGNWPPHPYNPDNNVNYTSKQSGLSNRYPDHPSRDRQPFFHTIPGMKRYQKRCDIIRKYQERFVAKLLSYSLDHGNVLYCMDNETSTPPAWGRHWMTFIREKAKAKGVSVYVTDMFDDVWQPEKSEFLPMAIDRPDLYLFLDVSQVNSRNFGQAHWDRFQWIVKRSAKHPRPLNHTKIYSDGETRWGSGTPKDGVERFWRNIVGGAASSRFHRPTSGIGLNKTSQACIRAARKVESVVRFWDVEPHMELLRDRKENEAYLAAKPGTAYVLFFTDGGTVGLDLTKHNTRFGLRWVSVSKGEWGTKDPMQGGKVVAVKAPSAGPWVAVIAAE